MKPIKMKFIKTKLARLGGGMKVSGTSIKHHKRRGEWAEMRFMARASEHGFSVSKPWGETQAYDFIIEHEGRFLRVQVKSTGYRRNRSYQCRIRGCGGRKYSSHEMDFIAVYVIPKNIWFIFPVEVVLRSQSDLILSPHLEVSKNGAYEEAWHLMLSGNAASSGQAKNPSVKLLPAPDEHCHAERG